MSNTISPNSTIAKYTIGSKIGAGGMGGLRARDPKLGRDVAIKVLPSSFFKCIELNYQSLQVIAQGLRHGTVLPYDPGTGVLTFIQMDNSLST